MEYNEIDINEHVRRLSCGRHIDTSKPHDAWCALQDLERIWVSSVIPPRSNKWHQRVDFYIAIRLSAKDDDAWERFKDKFGNDDVYAMLDAYEAGVAVDDIIA